MIDSRGIEQETTYPYSGRKQRCDFGGSRYVQAKISNYEYVAEGDEEGLKAAVANNGPVAVGVNAEQQWQFYKSGIFNDPNCDPDGIDHAVLVVGYGTSDDGQDYWLIKNSWGDEWGENGYIRLARGVNMCGVANQASYPIVWVIRGVIKFSNYIK